MELFPLSNPENKGITLSQKEVEALKELAYVYRQLNSDHQTTDTEAYKLATKISSL